jgi:hypothetical protein
LPAMARRGRARLGSRRECARTRTGPGFLGPQHGHAVRGAPASRARGTTRRRRGDGGCGKNKRRDGSCIRTARWPDGEWFLRMGYRGLIGIADSTREKGGGGGAHR